MILKLLGIQHTLNMHIIIITIQSGNRNEMFSVDVSVNLLKTENTLPAAMLLYWRIASRLLQQVIKHVSCQEMIYFPG